MKWIQTPDSSAILRFGYDPARQVLEVTFKEGESYKYLRVPSRVFDAMQAAPSKGQFVTTRIIGHYEFRRSD